MVDPVRLTERRASEPLSPEQWQHLEANEQFWRLEARRVLSVAHHRAGVRLTPGPWIGRARCGTVDIEIVEKVPGTLAALWSHAHLTDFRVERVAAPAAEPGDLFPLIIKSFLSEATEYLRRGREFRYCRATTREYVAGGRIDFPATALLRASGFPQLTQFDKPVIDRRTEKNQVVAAALLTVPRLASVLSVPAEDVVQANALSMYFSDCQPGLDLRRLDALATRADALAVRREHTRDLDLLALAALVLTQVSFDRDDPLDALTPRTWFINLEVLFERAVRNVADRLTLNDVRVSTGAGWLRPVIGVSTFDEETETADEGSPALTPVAGYANPDVVLESAGTFPAIGDVKYKTWSGRVSRPDLYQLLVHTAAFASTRSFIVQPADDPTSIDLGQSAVGSEVTLIGVRPTELEGDLRLGLATMGVLPPD